MCVFQAHGGGGARFVTPKIAGVTSDPIDSGELVIIDQCSDVHDVNAVPAYCAVRKLAAASGPKGIMITSYHFPLR